MPINETFYGFIETTTDALLMFEACRRGLLPKIGRRLQERERCIIRSGSVFIFDEKESGIKRWTDGRTWSPSRILGNFLVYRELDNKETLKHEPYYTPRRHEEERQRDRNLIGSLTDTYKFLRDGLIKKTISIHINGYSQHLVSYYSKADVINAKLTTPSSTPHLASLHIAPELLLKQSFRIPPSTEFAELTLLKGSHYDCMQKDSSRRPSFDLDSRCYHAGPPPPPLSLIATDTTSTSTYKYALKSNTTLPSPASMVWSKSPYQLTPMLTSPFSCNNNTTTKYENNTFT